MTIGGWPIRLQDVAVASPFWYRRLAEISLLIDAIILALFGLTLAAGNSVETLMRIDIFTAAAAAVNAVMAIFTIIKQKSETLVALSAVTYGMLAITVSLLIFTTGGISSPYVALWMLVATFAVLFSTPGLVIMGLLANGYIVWQFISPAVGVTSSRLMMFALAVDLPLVVSYIIWHKKKQVRSSADKAVSDLKQQLNEVANQADIVISSIADGVLAIDKNGVIRLMNPAAQTLLGWSKAEALNLQYDAVVKLADKRDQLVDSGHHPIEQVRITKQPIVNNDLTLISKAGKKMVVSLVVSPMLANNEVEGAIVVFRDITAEKAQEREQVEFISTASHEMRTPVAAIEGYLALALNPQTAAIDDKARLYLGKAQEAVQHLGRLFQDLLTVSRTEDARLENHPKVTDMVAYIGSITEGLQPKAQQKGLQLIFDPAFDKPNDGVKTVSPIFYANVDRDHLREVVANLIENGIKYTKQGEVHVNVTGEDRKINITVRDSGIGIPREDIPHLFQKFYRVDNSDTREIGGTGLGLYISRRLIESMQGKLWVESELGKGSTFFVSVPRVSNLDIRHMQESQAIENLQHPGEELAGAHPFSEPQQKTDVAIPAPLTIASSAPQAATEQQLTYRTASPAQSRASFIDGIQPRGVSAQQPQAIRPQPAQQILSTPQQQPTPEYSSAQAQAYQPTAQYTPPQITPQPTREPTIAELQQQYAAQRRAQQTQQYTDVYPQLQTPQNLAARGSISVPTR